MKKFIHVNQHVIKANRKTGERNHPLTCKTYKSNTLASTVELLNEKGEVVARLVYSPDKPLDCGAHVWLESELEVRCS